MCTLIQAVKQAEHGRASTTEEQKCPFFQTNYSEHLLSRTPTAKRLEITNVRDGGKFKILAFYKALGKPNTVFTFVLTLEGLKGVGERKYIHNLTAIGILFSVKISQNARLFSKPFS